MKITKCVEEIKRFHTWNYYGTIEGYRTYTCSSCGKVKCANEERLRGK